MKMRIIILKHAFFESPNYILNLIKRKNIEYKIINIYKNEQLPVVNSFDFLIIMGGPMGVYGTDKYPWLDKEKYFIKESIKKNRKILGICLGAQLIAECLGAKVYKNKYKEIGWFPVYLTEEGKDNFLFKEIPEKFITFHWHNDTFDMPNRAEHLAYSKACKNQAFIYGKNILGLQFHPEITYKGLKAFVDNFKTEIKKEKYVQNKDKLLGEKIIVNQNHNILKNIINKIIS